MLRHEDCLQNSQDATALCLKEAHNPVCGSSHTASAVREVNLKCTEQLGQYIRRQNRENMEPKIL